MADIVDIRTIRPDWDDVVIVTADYGNLPGHMRMQVAKQIKDHIKEVFPNNKVIVISTKTEIELKKESEITIPEVAN